jgi:hypothetical protein
MPFCSGNALFILKRSGLTLFLGINQAVGQQIIAGAATEYVAFLFT